MQNVAVVTCRKDILPPPSPSHHIYIRKTWSCSAVEEQGCQKSVEERNEKLTSIRTYTQKIRGPFC